MTISIEVYRQNGTHDGGEIQEELLGESLQAALARGQAELDANATAWEQIDLELGYRPDLRCGMCVEVNDPWQGAAWIGRVIGIAHQCKGDEAITKLTLKRPIE